MIKLKLIVVALFAAFVAALLLTDNAANPHARAFSAGPPAGYTHASGELDCSECHTTPTGSPGTLTLVVPQHYTPAQTSDTPVTLAPRDQWRIDGGLEMTARVWADEKAGSFEAPGDARLV